MTSIRELAIDDAAALGKLLDNNELDLGYMTHNPKNDVMRFASVEDYVSSLLEVEDARFFAIEHCDSLVGVISLLSIANGAAELSYCNLSPTLTNKGIMTQAVRLITDYAFSTTQLDMVYCYINNKNIASIKVAAKNKFALVGRSIKSNDVSRYEMTRTGWNRKKAKELRS
ncbi:MAG: GNAT family N-acetyltransferase [Bacteroidales bacterium]|nr:GNAT family N-acetyltransferase [Bacteroidales bacterium]